MTGRLFDYSAALGLGCLGIATLACASALVGRRVWLGVVGSVLAVLTTFLFSVLYATVPGLVFLAVTVATVLGVWALFRKRRPIGSISEGGAPRG